MGFKEIKPEELLINPFTKIGKDWMLITAGNEKKYNTMTAGWGGVGVLWGKNAATTYIRPQRYTREFVDANEIFTIAFFDTDHKDALKICGAVSGRDADKVKKAGLTPLYIDGTVSFEEAALILICKKMYRDVLKPELFTDPEIDGKWYPEKDYHIVYISEILKVLVKE